MASINEDDHGRDQARLQFESIEGMIKRLQHARECTDVFIDDGCELLDSDILDGLGYSGEEATDEQRSEYHDEDAAQTAIDEDPLSVEIRSDWHTANEAGEAAEFNILLCTGGPACRILGELDEHGEPTRAYLQYQDWGTPWTDYYEPGIGETLLAYARCFYFGEGS